MSALVLLIFYIVFAPSLSVSDDEVFVDKIQHPCNFFRGHFLLKCSPPVLSLSYSFLLNTHILVLPHKHATPLILPPLSACPEQDDPVFDDGHQIRQKCLVPFISTKNLYLSLTTNITTTQWRQKIWWWRACWHTPAEGSIFSVCRHQRHFKHSRQLANWSKNVTVPLLNIIWHNFTDLNMQLECMYCRCRKGLSKGSPLTVCTMTVERKNLKCRKEKMEGGTKDLWWELIHKVLSSMMGVEHYSSCWLIFTALFLRQAGFTWTLLCGR